MATEPPQPNPPEELDLTNDDNSPESPEPVVIPYDPEKARDDIRGKLALRLITLLTFIVVAAFVSIWLPVLIAWSKGGYIDISMPLKDTLQLLMAPVVGLVGAATGYYFGVSAQKPNQPSK
jgi:hypothetical protein